jgi:hypothetical protein
MDRFLIRKKDPKDPKEPKLILEKKINPLEIPSKRRAADLTQPQSSIATLSIAKATVSIQAKTEATASSFPKNPLDRQQKPTNHFQIEEQKTKKKKVDQNLTKIHKLSYLIQTEYFNLTLDQGEGKMEYNLSDTLSPTVHSVVGEAEEEETADRDQKYIEEIDDGEEGEKEDHTHNPNSRPPSQMLLEDYFDLDPTIAEEQIRRSAPPPSLTSASPYFSRIPTQFYQNPAQYSKPFHLYRSNISSLLMQRFRSPHSSISRINDTNSSSYPPSRGGGITCLEFDPVGVLIAIASANGQLKIYDSDEILFHHQRSSSSSASDSQLSSSQRQLTVPPVFTLSTSKSISALSWIPTPPYEAIALAFLYHSTIDIVDCSTNELVGQLLLKSSSRRGYTALHTIPATSSSSSLSAQWHLIIAGNSFGQLYLWRYPARSSPTMEVYSSTPLWEAHGDPSSQPNELNGIIGIFSPLTMSHLVLTLTRSGVLSLWDTLQLSLLSFSSTRTPTLLQTSSLRSSSTWLINKAVFDSLDESSFSVTERVLFGKKSYRLNGVLFLLLSNGERVSYDLFTSSMTPLPGSSSSSSMSGSSILVQDTLQSWSLPPSGFSRTVGIQQSDVKGIDFMQCGGNVRHYLQSTLINLPSLMSRSCPSFLHSRNQRLICFPSLPPSLSSFLHLSTIAHSPLVFTIPLS